MPLKLQDIAAVVSLCLGYHSFTVLFAWQAGIRCLDTIRIQSHSLSSRLFPQDDGLINHLLEK